MSELKALSKDAIPAALEKATRYRLLNEPAEAESICLDVLKADPENQEAIVTLLLALTAGSETGTAVTNTFAKQRAGLKKRKQFVRLAMTMRCFVGTPAPALSRETISFRAQKKNG